MKTCLYCYEDLSELETDFHAKCSKKFFGLNKTPILAFGKTELKEIAKQIIIKSVAITGVQPKLSLELEKINSQNSRLTIVGLWGNFILKPPTEHFPDLPQNEDLTMKLAALCGINVAEHSLIRLNSGELAYITKRFDRKNGGKKIHVEDLCQLTETPTEHKYRSSMEKAGKAIRRFSTHAGLDVLAFFELTIFCFLTGNADMHLKNFSLLRTENDNIHFAPAYDLLSTKLAMPSDNEQMALTLNGKKNRLKKSDFEALAQALDLNSKAVERIYAKFEKKTLAMKTLISSSFLDKNAKDQYKNLLNERLSIFKTN